MWNERMLRWDSITFTFNPANSKVGQNLSHFGADYTVFLRELPSFWESSSLSIDLQALLSVVDSLSVHSKYLTFALHSHCIEFATLLGSRTSLLRLWSKTSIQRFRSTTLLYGTFVHIKFTKQSFALLYWFHSTSSCSTVIQRKELKFCVDLYTVKPTHVLEVWLAGLSIMQIQKRNQRRRSQWYAVHWWLKTNRG